MKTIVKLVLVVAICAMGFAAPAAATTINVTDVEMPYKQALTLSSFDVPTSPNPLVTTHFGGGSFNAGQFVLTTNIGLLGAWCIDLFHSISLGVQNLTYNDIPLSSTNNNSTPSNSAQLTQAQIDRIQSLGAYGNTLLGSQSNNNAFAAAVQAAIWLAEYGGYGLTIAGCNGDCATYLGAIPSSLPLAGGVQLESVDATGLFVHQNLELPVPEPGTLALVGSILVALGLLRRRLRQPTSSI